MTKEMLQDFIKILKRKNALLTIIIIIVSLGLVGMTFFAISSYEAVENNGKSCNITKQTQNEAACIVPQNDIEMGKQNGIKNDDTRKRGRRTKK